jgi:hypothetical protein
MDVSSVLRSAAAAALLSSLSACYVVPVDLRTGQPVLPPEIQAAKVPAPGAVAPAPAQLQARLYPLNDQANAGGLLVAQVSDNHAGRGSITLTYRGVLMQGESTRVDGSYPSFGSIHNAVLGTASRSYSGRRGIANAYGAGGVGVQCEYVITGPGIGTGACLFSDGAKYQLHFGG